MYKECKTAKSRARQKQIISAFYGMLKNMSFNEITVSELCVKSNIPRKAFYRYFDSKIDVIDALVLSTLSGYQSFYANHKSESRVIKGELECFFAFFLQKEQHQLVNILMKNNLLSSLFSFSKISALQSFVNMQKFLPNENHATREYIFSFAITGLISMMLDWLNSGCKKTPAEMAEISVRLLSSPLFSEVDFTSSFID